MSYYCTNTEKSELNIFIIHYICTSKINFMNIATPKRYKKLIQGGAHARVCTCVLLITETSDYYEIS
jgi:hypothetical protein